MDAERIADEVAARVREALAEAERRANEIVAEAEREAERIRARAEAEAERRLDAMRRALDDLEGRLGQTDGDPGPATVPEPEPPAVPEPTPDPVPNPIPGPETVPEPAPEPVPEPVPPPDEGDLPSAAPNGERSSDEAAARLVAMDLALEGVSRDEALARLGDQYDLPDLESLVDEVFARAAGRRAAGA